MTGEHACNINERHFRTYYVDEKTTKLLHHTNTTELDRQNVSLCVSASDTSSLSLVLHALEVLPVAPPLPPHELTEEEALRLEEQEEDTLRELRLFLRDVTNRLSQDKRFKAFTKPVDLEEVAVQLFKIVS